MRTKKCSGVKNTLSKQNYLLQMTEKEYSNKYASVLNKQLIKENNTNG